MAFISGIDAKLYYGSTALLTADEAGVNGVTWTELDNVTSVNSNLETGEADVTTRANTGFRAYMVTLKDGTIEFEMIWDTTDTGLETIETAWIEKTEISILCLDQERTTVGARGLASNMRVTNYSRAEETEDAIRVSVTLRPSSKTFWYKSVAPAS